MSKKKAKGAGLEYFEHAARGNLIKSCGNYFVLGDVKSVFVRNGQKEESKGVSIMIPDEILDTDFLDNILECEVAYRYLEEKVSGALLSKSIGLNVIDLPKNKKTLEKIMRKIPKCLRKPKKEWAAPKKAGPKPRRDVILCPSPMSVVGQGDAE